MPSISNKTNGFAAKLGKSKGAPPAVGEGSGGSEAKAVPAPANTGGTKKPKPLSRQGKRHISGHFDAAVWRQLRLLAIEESTTTQALLEEGLDLLFHARRLPTIATPVRDRV